MERPPNLNREAMIGEFPGEIEPPLATEPMEQDLVVRFGQNYLSPGQTISVDQAAQAFDADWFGNDNLLYTLLLIDNDRPYPNNRIDSPYLLTLIIDIPGNNYENGYAEMPYEAPQVPEDSAPHRLTLLIFQQTRHLSRGEPTLRMQPRPHRVRAGFNLGQYLHRHRDELYQIARFDFYVAARQRGQIRAGEMNRQQLVGPTPMLVSEQFRNVQNRCGCSGSSYVNNFASIAPTTVALAASILAAPTDKTSLTAPQVKLPSPAVLAPVAKAAALYQTHRIVANAPIEEQEAKYCSCVLQVQAKDRHQPSCTAGIWGSTRSCVNPYAVCHASVGGAYIRDCAKYYNWQELSDDELMGYAAAQRSQIPIPNPYDRQQMLSNIRQWKAKRGETM